MVWTTESYLKSGRRRVYRDGWGYSTAARWLSSYSSCGASSGGLERGWWARGGPARAPFGAACPVTDGRIGPGTRHGALRRGAAAQWAGDRGGRVRTAGQCPGLPARDVPAGDHAPAGPTGPAGLGRSDGATGRAGLDGPGGQLLP